MHKREGAAPQEKLESLLRDKKLRDKYLECVIKSEQ
jgi:hypothetical protein